MMNRFLYLKRMLRTVLLVLLLSIAGMTKAQTENITFADANVKAICVANWDTDGDGELNTTEAAAVTNLDGMFMFDDGITSFNELQFFTGLTSFGEDEFNSCTSLASITIPNAVTSIGNYAFSDCSSLTTMTSYACTPPILGNEVFYNVPSVMVLNVPCHTSAMYQEADGWSDFSNYEEFEYGLCPIPFADATVKAICVAHWDTNEDGELSYAEAAAVTNLGTYFKSTSITSFEELEYFTSVTSLPNTAFYGCTSLASIALPSSVSALGNGSFYNCTNLATMTVYAETPPTVGTNAFKNVPTDMVVYVPCGTYEAYHTASTWSEFIIVQQSGSCPIVFADAYVKALCVTNWDTNGDGELSYDEAAAVTDLGQVFKNKSITSFNEFQYFYNLSSIGEYAFGYCSGLNSIEIPNSVTYIGKWAFIGCSGLVSIEIPNSVIEIDYCAFAGCSSMTSVIIPNSVTSIGQYTFINCTGLTSVTIGNSVSTIGGAAFGGCTNLTSIEIPSSVTSIVTNPFSDCSGLEQIIVDSGNTVYDSRENCNAIIKTNTNELVTGCKNTVIPNSVIEINYSAFSGCSGLISMTIPNSVTSIGTWAFSNCTGLISIGIPNSVTSIAGGVFSDCTSLTLIEIPNSVTSIAGGAFSNCTSLTIIEIPNSVTLIESNPFIGCSGLEQIIVDSGNTVFDSREICNAIIKTSNNALVTGCKNTVIPNSVTSIDQYAFYNCTSLTSVEIPNSVTSIGNGAFYNCTGLTSVEIPNSVTSIGYDAFSNCTGLTSVTSFAETPPILGNYVFSSVNKSIPVYVPCGASDTYQNTYGWNEFTNTLGMCPGTITVAASPTEGGSVTGSGSYEGGGATCTVTAIANHDYHFIKWTENGEMISSDAEYTFIVAGDRNLVANFFFTPPAPVVAEYYPDSNEPNSPYVKVHWAAGPYEVMIGDSTSTINTAYMPFYTLYDNSISEALYTAAELIEAGATAGSITSLSWEAVSVTTNQPQYNISIWMANVPDTELTTTSHLASNMTLVYTGNIGIPPLGWNEFFFNESNFVWDGTSNVLILCQRNNGQWNGSVRWRSHDPGFYGMAYKYQDGTPYDVTSQIYTLYLSNTVRPNIIMKCERPMTYNLYRANCDGTDVQLIAENVNDSQYIDETWWQLENASYKYGLSVVDSTSTDIFWSNCIEKQGDVVVQTVALSEGWNWFSTYIELDDPVELLEMLQDVLGDNGMQIESVVDGINMNVGDGYWAGDLDGTGLLNEHMYLIEVLEDVVVELQGPATNPEAHPITIYPNDWSWIGNPCAEEADVNVALSGFEAEEGDMIETLYGEESGVIYYYGGEWVGDFYTMIPGRGYMYFSNSTQPKTLIFSTTSEGKNIFLWKRKE